MVYFFVFAIVVLIVLVYFIKKKSDVEPIETPQVNAIKYIHDNIGTTEKPTFGHTSLEEIEPALINNLKLKYQAANKKNKQEHSNEKNELGNHHKAVEHHKQTEHHNDNHSKEFNLKDSILMSEIIKKKEH